MTTSFERSPQRWPRLGGALYLAIILLGLSGEVRVRGSLVVPGGLAAGQPGALSVLSIQAHGYGFAIGLVFFGLTCLVRRHLIVRSTYLPRWLGVPLPAFVGELALGLRPMARGVNLQRCKP